MYEQSDILNDTEVSESDIAVDESRALHVHLTVVSEASLTATLVETEEIDDMTSVSTSTTARASIGAKMLKMLSESVKRRRTNVTNDSSGGSISVVPPSPISKMSKMLGPTTAPIPPSSRDTSEELRDLPMQSESYSNQTQQVSSRKALRPARPRGLLGTAIGLIKKQGAVFSGPTSDKVLVKAKAPESRAKRDKRRRKDKGGNGIENDIFSGAWKKVDGRGDCEDWKTACETESTPFDGPLKAADVSSQQAGE